MTITVKMKKTTGSDSSGLRRGEINNTFQKVTDHGTSARVLYANSKGEAR